MSVLGKKWVIKNTDKSKTTFEKILSNRGMQEVEELKDFHDPFLFSDMKHSAERIEKAVKDKERIIIFGDYDADGITAAAILIHTLKKMGANLSYRLPNRVTDGYGLSEKFIDEFIEKNIKLVITVDCGISCGKEIKKAKEAGIDVIITDHHAIPSKEPESSYAILHPKYKNSKYPFKELTGAGVALKLAQALIYRNLTEEDKESFFFSLLDLATIGTIADLGPLVDENKLIVKKGLEILENTKWHGLKKIKELTNIKDGDKIDPGKIGFQIAPRLNAAGRIGDPYDALHLLIQGEDNEKVTFLSKKLDDLNKTRQEMTDCAMEEAVKTFSVNDLPYIFISSHPKWHVGILGLIAGKLVEKYSRPAVILQDLGDVLVASARSTHNFNIVEALALCGDYLISFGGHAQAAGFSIKKENLEKFTDKISKHAEKQLSKCCLAQTLDIDCELDPNEINFDLLEQIEKLKPFGVGSSRPSFVINDMQPFFVEKVGATGGHIKFSVRIGDRDFKVIGFKLGEFTDKVRSHKSIDVVFHIDRDNFRNRNDIQLQALDLNLRQE